MVIWTPSARANIVPKTKGVSGKAAWLCLFNRIARNVGDNFGKEILHSIFNDSELSCFSVR